LREVTEDVGGEEKSNTVYTFEKDGKVYHLKPDAGWGTNLGIKAWNLDVLAYSKIKELPPKIKDKFISDMMSNQHNREYIQTLIIKTIQNNLKSKGLEHPITWFSPLIIQSLEKNNIRIQTPVVVFEDRQVKHSLYDKKVEKQRLTKKQFLNIYSFLNGPDEIYIDTKDLAVIYVKYLSPNEIIDNRNCIKIPVKINSNNSKRPVNYIGTTGRINIDSIKKDKRYKKIE